MVDLDTSLKSVPPLPLPEKIEKSVDIMPGFLKSLVQAHPTQRARRLASEFHQLESLEQSRLSDVMQWHSASQRDSSESAQNPLSISAGVEKGHLNRYRNIFPVS